MKINHIFVLSAAVLMLGCSSPSNSSPAGSAAPATSKGEEMYEKYKELIDALEAKDYEKAKEYVTSLMPEPEEVTLTVDNWSDYFEVRKEDTFDKDAYGVNLTESTKYLFELKPEYENAVLNNVVIGFEYENKCYKVVNLNKEDGTYDTEVATDQNILSSIFIDNSLGQYSESLDVTGTTPLVFCSYYPLDSNGAIELTGKLYLQDADDHPDQYIVMPDHIDIVTVSGSISIAK